MCGGGEGMKRRWSVRVEEKVDEVGEREGNDVELGVDSRGLKWHKNADKGKEVVSHTFW
jgi:hypothetical protein